MAVSTSGTVWHSSNRGLSLYISIYLFLFLIILVLSKFLHDYPKIGSIIPEAAMIILVGMIAGLFIFLFGPASNETEYGQTDVVYYDQYGQAVVQEEDNYNGNNNNNNNGLIQNTDSLADSLLSFSPTVFFVILLPPIIYNSGYHINKILFFRHLTPIAMYAFVGTAICTMVVASLLYNIQWIYNMDASLLELMTFGALISATDPVSTLAVFSSKKVDPHLFYLVFGESVLNDAVGLVLFDALAHLLENHNLMMIQQSTMNNNGDDDVQTTTTINVGEEVAQFLFDFFVAFIGSLILGIMFAVGMAILLKYIDFRSTPILEFSITVTFMYLPFVIAELLHLSGIVTVLFAGIACRRYVEPNLSDITRVNADWVYRLTAHVTEAFIFLELGLSVWSLLGKGAFSFGFFIAALLACLIGRAFNIYPLTLLFNIFNGRKAKDNRTQDAVQEAEETNYVAANDEPESEAPAPEETPKVVNESSAQIIIEQGSTTSAIVEPSVSFEDDSKIPWRTANMMWFSGLRGAVSYGLVRTFPDTESKSTIVVTTMLLVLLTTFLLGGFTERALEFLKIPVNIDETMYLRSISKRKLLPNFMLRFEKFQLYNWVVRDDAKKKIKKKDDDHRGPNNGCDDDNDDHDDDPELTPYETFEVTEHDFHHRISVITQTNRNGLIFDYGA